jgi:hypothetical protein
VWKKGIIVGAVWDQNVVETGSAPFSMVAFIFMLNLRIILP